MGLEALTTENFRGGAGSDTGKLRTVLDQIRGIRQFAYTATADIAAGVLATKNVSDGSNTTLRIDARLPGEHGNSIFYETIRKTLAVGQKKVFDLNVFFPDRTHTPQAFTAAVTDICTDAAHGLVTGDVVLLATSDTLPAGLTAVPYYVIWVSTDTFKLATSLANALAGTAVDITDTGTGTHTWQNVVIENFPNVSMVDTDKRYVETIVNQGGDGTLKSEYITAWDQDSVTAGDEADVTRPANTALATALASGAGEVTVTGLARNDHIAAVVNLSVPATPAAPGTYLAVDVNKAAVKVGGDFTTANTNVVLLTVLPAQ